MTEPHATIVTIVQSLSGAKQSLAIGLDESLFDAGVLDSFLLPELIVALEKASRLAVENSILRA